MNFSNKTVLIAGASTGIGRAVALQLGTQGNRIIATARRQELLDALADKISNAGGECLPIAADALNAMDMADVVNKAVERFGVIDAALLNIGDGPSFNMSTTGADAVKQNMRINYDTLVNSLMPLIARMKEQKYGLIAHTNSLAGFIGLPQQGPYSAAKAAGRILMDTCRIELAPWNIRFVSVYPGFVATERVAADGIPAPMEISEGAAAKHIIYAMENEKRDYLFPFPLRWLIRLARILPKPVVAFITSKMMAEEY
ncbi:SDR family NAD(P)-dependent oxidoreductase [Parendozoicomonas sp. Alg238-R29]|uniref:SDR family NAD(P)-dependent oxidoreductase n=1 Tax=Parendozoicomonas sp. Alg238-R29 TaxID=2993446 RepID=UPI00248E9CAF|nr:SDR family NAD(P)-dependent oxidoreductase [Parendozoicomonas sp. Alg238-R29]